MLKLLRKLKYAMLSKTAERKINDQYGCKISMNIKEIEVPQENGEVSIMVKTEIITYKKDYEKIISSLSKKGR